jgi:hypothetical protein
MKKLNGVLNGEDVIRMLLIDVINDGCQSRRFARPCRSGHQHNAVEQPSNILKLGRQIQLREGGNFAGNHSHYDRAGAPLHEHIDAKSGDPGETVGHIARTLFAQVAQRVFVAADQLRTDVARVVRTKRP